MQHWNTFYDHSQSGQLVWARGYWAARLREHKRGACRGPADGPRWALERRRPHARTNASTAQTGRADLMGASAPGGHGGWAETQYRGGLHRRMVLGRDPIGHCFLKSRLSTTSTTKRSLKSSALGPGASGRAVSELAHVRPSRPKSYCVHGLDGQGRAHGGPDCGDWRCAQEGRCKEGRR